MINKTKTQKKLFKANNLPKMYPRFVCVNLKHRKIESVTFAALKGPIATIHSTKHPSVTGRVASIFSPGFRKKTSPGRQIFHQVAPFCQVAMLPFSITNDAGYVKVAPGKPQTSREKVSLGLLQRLWLKRQPRFRVFSKSISALSQLSSYSGS